MDGGGTRNILLCLERSVKTSLYRSWHTMMAYFILIKNKRSDEREGKRKT